MSSNQITNVAYSNSKMYATNIRSEFPYLRHFPSLVYLDSAASSQKPESVINSISHYYESSHANIHRGVYALSQKATDEYDASRATVAKFLNAHSSNEIVFLRGTTEGFNLLAQSFLKPRLNTGDEIIVSIAEHHANIVPWQLVCKEAGATIRALPLNENLQLDIDSLENLINKNTKLISLTHVSNALGTVTDIKKAISIAKKHNIPVAIDGAQAVPHIQVDVRALDCDFYLFSGHKLYGPTGIGVLYARQDHLDAMPPYQGGGDMIELVEINSSTYAESPQKFEAGTPHIAGAIGLREAIKFITQIGYSYLEEQEKVLQDKVQEILSSIDGISIFGAANERVGLVSFVADWGHPHDIGTILDQHQVAVRTGHHCAQPLLRALGQNATTRVSFGVYSTPEELEILHKGLLHARKLLA